MRARSPSDCANVYSSFLICDFCCMNSIREIGSGNVWGEKERGQKRLSDAGIRIETYCRFTNAFDRINMMLIQLGR